MNNPLSEFQVVTELPVQWGDQDAFQHVNNTVHLRWYESGRIDYLMRTGCNVSDEGVSRLVGHLNLESLSLSRTAITDATVHAVSGSDSLSWLNLSYTRVTDASMVDLCALKNLRCLILDGTRVSNRHLRRLTAELTRLHLLVLRDTEARDDGVRL